MIATPADALVVAKQLLAENQELLKTVAATGNHLTDADARLIDARAAQTQALAAWATAQRAVGR